MGLILHWEVRFGTRYHHHHRVLSFMEVIGLIVHILPETLWEL